MFLRDGIDKVMLTVRPKDLSFSYSFPKGVFERYRANGNVVQLKFNDRWSRVIKMSKYDWQGEPAIVYMQRLDQFRQCRVLVNLMRFYNIQNELDYYTKALFDNNVVIPSRMFDTSEFVVLMKQLLPEIMQDYCTIRDFVFGDPVTVDTLTVDTHQIEMVQEGIGMHTSDIAHVFTDHAKCESVVRYFDHTQTLYLNTATRKNQLKIYQKGVGIMRLEATLNNRPNDVVCEWQAPSTVIAQRLNESFAGILSDMQIPIDWWRGREMELDTIIYLFADMLALTDEEGKTDTDLMKVLLSSSVYKYKDLDKNLVQRLVRKKLITRSSYGVYVPTKRLIELQDLFRRIKRSKELFKDEA